MTLRGNLLKFLLGTTLLFSGANIAKGGAVSGRIFNAHNNQTSNGTNVEVIVNDGSSGIAPCTMPYFGDYGLWMIDSGYFLPEPSLGDTIKMSSSLNVSGTNYTAHAKTLYLDANQILPTTFLKDPNKNVPCVSVGASKVKSQSTKPLQLRAKGNLRKNPEQKMQFINYYLRATVPTDSMKVDTSDIYTQLYFNTQKQDSNFAVNDTFDFELYQQTAHDTTFFQQYSMPIDTNKYGGASMLDSVVYNGSNFRVFKDLSVENILTTLQSDSGANVKLKASAKNNGAYLPWTAKLYHTVSDSATGSIVLSDSSSLSLNAGQTKTDSSLVWNANIPGTYTHRCSLSVDGDNNPTNNVKSKYIKINPMGVSGEPEQRLPVLKRPFKAYPNPVRGLNEVKFDKPGKYKIYNNIGQYIGSCDGKSPMNFNVNDGLYFIRESGKDGNFTSKLMVVH